MNYIIKNVDLFDAVDGKIRPQMSVAVRDGLIEAVFSGENPAYQGYTELSTTGLKNPCLLPGLMDVHLHLGYGGYDSREKFQEESYYHSRFVHNGVKTLQSGVTTVRDCGSRFHYDAKYKKALALRLIPGPRTLICGQPIIATGGHCPYMGRMADGPDEVVKAVREQIEAKVDYIKLMVTGGIVTPTGRLKYAQLTNDEIAAATKVAHMNLRKVSAHAYGGDGIGDCIKQGVDILDHGIYLTPEHIKIMQEHQTRYVPTLSAIYSIAEFGAEEPVPYGELAISKAKDAVKYHFESVQMAKEAGILIAAGTDYKHGQLSFELELLTKAGFTRAEAILAATREAARFLDREEQLGTVEAGKAADLILVDGDPLADLAALQKPSLVMLGGQVACQDGLVAWPETYLNEPIQ